MTTEPLLKTSHQWYDELPYHSKVYKNLDGFTDWGSELRELWMTKNITQDEFMSRMSRCSQYCYHNQEFKAEYVWYPFYSQI